MKTTYTGSCHCGFVTFEIDADIDHVRECDCSICTKRGALMHRISEADFRLQTPLVTLSLYEWGTHTAKDYFCPNCGILPFRRPSHPSDEELCNGTPYFDGWAVNIRCLDRVDLSAIPRKQIFGKKIRLP